MSRRRYSLRLLLIVVAFVAIVSSFVARSISVARQEREALALVMERRGEVRREDDYEEARAFSRIRKFLGAQKAQGSILEVCAHPASLCDDDLAMLSKLKKLKTIVTNRWMDPATGGAKLVSSQDLDSMGHPLITDEGVQHLSRLDHLEAIVLLNTNVSDTGIAALSRLPSLEILHISSPLVTDAAIPYITKLKSLTVFSSAGTSISEEGQRELRARLPNCTISTVPYLVGK